MKVALASLAILLSAFLAGAAVAQHKVHPDCISEYAYKKTNKMSFDKDMQNARKTLDQIGKLHSLSVDDIILVKCESEDAIYAYEGPINDDQGAEIETGRYIFVNQRWVDRTIGADHIQELALYAHEFSHLKDEHFTKKKHLSRGKKEIEADRFAACTVAHYDQNAWRTLREFFIRLRPIQEEVYASRAQTLIEAAEAFRDCNGIVPLQLDPKRPYSKKVFITPVRALQSMSEADIQASLPLYAKLNKLALPTLKYLRPPASLQTDSWMTSFAAQLFNRHVLWNEENIRKVLTSYIATTNTGENLQRLGIDQVYWIFIGITPNNVVKSALVVIDINVGALTTGDPIVIHSPVLGESFTVSDGSDEAVTDIIVRGLLKIIVPMSIVPKGRGLVHNQMIFPSCILRLGEPDQRQLRPPMGFLGREITDIFSGRKGDGLYQSALDECFVRESGKSDNDYWPVGRLAEFVIELTFTSEAHMWEVRPSWDSPNKGKYRKGPDKFNLADCHNQLKLVIANIVGEWEKVLQAVRNDE